MDFEKSNPQTEHTEGITERASEILVGAVVRVEAWLDEANCLGVDPDLFYPERGASSTEAKETCRGCTVRLDCLEYAMVNGEKFGIWGGLSKRERRRIRSRAAQARKAQA